MWHALRAELVYSRPSVVGGLGIGAGVALLISVILRLVGDQGPPNNVVDGLRAIFLIMAPMIVGFIAQSYRSEERRARLLLSGPLTPRQIAGSMVLLPVVLLGIGVLAAGLVIGAGALVTARLGLETVNLVGFMGGQLFAYVQMSLLAQEAAAARGQRRSRAAAVGWAGFVGAILLFAALYVTLAQGLLTWTHLMLGHLVVAAIIMVLTVELYAGRTDFTR